MPGVLSIKNSSFIVISSAAVQGDIDEVQTFSFDPKSEIKKYPGGFGYEGTKYVTAIYQDTEGEFSVQNTIAQKKVLAYLQGLTEAEYVGFHLKNAKTFYIVAHARDDAGQLVNASFVEGARITQKPTKYDDGAQQVNFTAPNAMDLGKEIAIKTFEGNATPVTSLALVDIPVMDPLGREVMLVLKDTATTKGIVLNKTTDYTIATGTITLLSGLTATDKALVVYLKP